PRLSASHAAGKALRLARLSSNQGSAGGVAAPDFQPGPALIGNPGACLLPARRYPIASSPSAGCAEATNPDPNDVESPRLGQVPASFLRSQVRTRAAGAHIQVDKKS